MLPEPTPCPYLHHFLESVTGEPPTPCTRLELDSAHLTSFPALAMLRGTPAFSRPRPITRPRPASSKHSSEPCTRAEPMGRAYHAVGGLNSTQPRSNRTEPPPPPTFAIPARLVVDRPVATHQTRVFSATEPRLELGAARLPRISLLVFLLPVVVWWRDPAGAWMKERKPAASSSALTRILAACVSQAKDYGRCIAAKVPEIEHNMCSKEFLALRACMQTAIKSKA